MKVYYHDNTDADQRLPHEGDPVTPADLEALGVFASYIPEQADVDRIAKERGYQNRDEVDRLLPRLQHSLLEWSLRRVSKGLTILGQNFA